MPAPVRYPNGVSTAAPNAPFYMLPRDYPTRLHTFFDDFNSYTSGNWTKTSTGAGTVAASTTLANGVLVLTNSTGTTDQNEIQFNNTCCAAVSGKQWWLAARVSATATIANFGYFVGLSVIDTSVLASTPTDVIGFRSPTGGTGIVSVVRASSTETTASIGTAVSGTYNELVMYYNAKDAIECFVDGVKVNTITTLTNMPTVALSPTIATINATTGAANVLNVDWFNWMVER